MPASNCELFALAVSEFWCASKYTDVVSDEDVCDEAYSMIRYIC